MRALAVHRGDTSLNREMRPMAWNLQKLRA